MYIKSPFNYIGNKYRLLPQIVPLFPKNIDVFYDLFCGGLDVSINVKANSIVANDLNNYLIDIHKMFKSKTYDKLILEIENIIKKFDLSKENKETYYSFRSYYNSNKDPLLLYVLMCYSFNYQFRFNACHDFNNPAGTNRSSFNDCMKNRLASFICAIQQIKFENMNFKDFDYSKITHNDFIYCDPPYRTSVGSYNDGKRGFEGWSLEDDLALFDILDEINERNIKFALSNTIFNNGLANIELAEWSKKYNIHTLKCNYLNSNYQRNNCGETKEVLITNY